MNQFVPYTILHADLSDLKGSTTDINKTTVPYYLVVWWNKIPLGHYFHDSDIPLSDSPLDRIIDCITPTLNYYTSDLSLIASVEKSLQTHNQQELDLFLNEILGQYLPGEIPSFSDISVVICTRDRSEILQTCLLQLANQLCAPKEIVVVDNAPSNDLTEKLVKNFGNIIYVKENRPGLDIARNTGAYNASGSIVAYIDDDVVADPLLVYRIMNTFCDNTVDAMTGMVLPLSLQTESQLIFEKFWSFNKGFIGKKFTVDFLIPNGKICPKVWRIGAGANMAFRKEILQKVNYFDERLDAGAAGCSGDSEIWFRILLAKGKIVYDPLAVVFHEHRRDMVGLKKQLFNYMKGNVVAALIQHKQDPTLNFSRHVYAGMTKNYLIHILRKIKNPGMRHKTILPEAWGVLAGILYYIKNRNRSSVIPIK